MSELDIIRWGVSGLLALFWFIFAAGNIASMVSAARRKGSTSLMLLFGGIAGILALIICPIPGLWIWLWVPALLDIGTLPALAAMAYHAITQKTQ